MILNKNNFKIELINNLVELSIQECSGIFNKISIDANKLIYFDSDNIENLITRLIGVCYSQNPVDYAYYSTTRVYIKIKINEIIDKINFNKNMENNQPINININDIENKQLFIKNDLTESFIKFDEPMKFDVIIQNTTDFHEIKLSDFEYQYAQSLNRILENGIRCKNRTGIDTLAVQHQYFHIKDVSNNFPILRGKKVYPKMALKELIWMLKGRNDVKWLNDRKVTYWNEWVINDEQTAEKFDLNAEWIGTIGKSYGYQYRNFNGFDQVEALVNNMYKDPMGRRHIINLWNSADLKQMALPPCMYDFHFECIPTERINEKSTYYNVDLHVRVRSNDSFLGAPYDFMFVGWMLNLICNYLNHIDGGKDDGKYFKPNDIHYTADNYHLYVNHIEAAKQYINNVIENKEGVIDIYSNIAPCFLDDFYLHIEKPFTIDEYLNMLVRNIKNINIQWNKPLNGFEYGPIKAEIAV